MLLLLEESWERVAATLRERVGGAAYDSWLAGLRPVLIERGTVFLEAESRLAADRVRALYRQTICDVLSRDFGTELKVEIQAREADRFGDLEVSPQQPVVDDSNRTAVLLLQSLLPKPGGRLGSFDARGPSPRAPGSGASGSGASGSGASGSGASGSGPAGSGSAASGPPSGGLAPVRANPDPSNPGPANPTPSNPGAPNAASTARSGGPARSVVDPARRRAPTNLYVFHGPPGVGKTFLLRWWREQMPVRSMWFDLPQLLKAFQSAHHDRRVDRLHDELVTGLPLVLDELHRIAGKPGLQKFVLQVLRAREALAEPTLLASRWHPREIRELDESLGSSLLAGFVCGVERPGPMARLRYLRALEGAPSRNGRAAQVESLAQQAIGGYPELRAAWAASRGQALPPRYLELIDPGRVFQRTRDRVADKFGVSATDLAGKGQGRALSRARKVLALLCQQQGLSGGEIGRYLDRTRAAVSYLLKTLQRDLERSPELRALVEELT